MTAQGYAVALKDPAPEPLAPAAFLSGRGRDKDSVRLFLRSQPGFLGRDLTLDAAKELKAAADAAGLASILAAEGDIRPAPPPVKVVKLLPDDSGFYAQGGGAVKLVSFASVSLFTAAAFDAPVPPPDLTALEGSLFEKLRRLAGVPAVEPVSAFAARETFFRADIIAEDGQLRLLLEPQNMDFSPLGRDRAPSSFDNFRTLVGRFSAPCVNAVKNNFLAALISGKPLTPLKLASAQACDTELSRLLLVSATHAK